MRSVSIGLILMAVLGCVQPALGANPDNAMTAPLWLSDYSVARSVGAAGWLRSPVSAWMNEGAELCALGSFGFSRDQSVDGQGAGLAGAARWRGLTVGSAIERWRRLLPEQPRRPWSSPSRVSMGAGLELDGWLRFAAAWRRLYDLSDQLAILDTMDLGFQARPWRWLSFGLHVSDFFGNSLYRFPVDSGVTSGPVYRAGIQVSSSDKAWRTSVDIQWINGRRVQSVEGLFAWRDWLGLHGRWTVSPQNAADSRLGFFIRWRSKTARLVVGSRADLRQDGGFGLDARATFSSPTWQQIATWWRRRDQSGPVHAAELVALAERQSRGWEIPLTEQQLSDAASIAKAYLAMSNAMAAGKAKVLCSMFASEVELSVKVIDPAFSAQTRLTKSRACQQLLNRSGPWWRYLYDIGPAFLHREAAYLLGKLFAIHGSPYEWIPSSQEQAYAGLLRRQKPKLRCHTWRVLPARGYIGERREVEVVVLCDGLADYVVGLQGDAQHGFQLTRLNVRLQKAVP